MVIRTVSLAFAILSLVAPHISYTQLVSNPSALQLQCETSNKYPVKRFKKTKQLKSSHTASVRLYLEVDHASFLAHDSDSTRVHQWVSSFSNEVMQLYQNENINIEISEIYIWQIPDPYSQVSSLTNRLDLFSSTHKMGFNGDLAHLITIEQIGGGLSYLNSLCTSYEPGGGGPFSIGASVYPDVDTTEFATFWNKFILAHEVGHVLGSPHTHACAWGPTNDEPIDNCFSSEGGCPNDSLSHVPGSIMSYCYLSSRGIDLTAGFGPEPSQRIITNISGSSCLPNFFTNCTEGDSCDDGNPCTNNDRMNEYCQCEGIIIDINQNDICDMYEDCDHSLYITTIDHALPFAIAQSDITLTAQAPNQINLNYSAGQSITLEQGFEIPLGSTFNTYLHGCKISN